MKNSPGEDSSKFYRLIKSLCKLEEASIYIDNAKYEIENQIREEAIKNQLPLSLKFGETTVKIRKIGSGYISIIIE